VRPTGFEDQVPHRGHRSSAFPIVSDREQLLGQSVVEDDSPVVAATGKAEPVEILQNLDGQVAAAAAGVAVLAHGKAAVQGADDEKFARLLS